MPAALLSEALELADVIADHGALLDPETCERLAAHVDRAGARAAAAKLDPAVSV